MIKCASQDGPEEGVRYRKMKKMRECLHSNVTLRLVCHRWKLRTLQILYPLHAA